VSRAWITAAIIFFFASCCFGGLVMAGLNGPEGLGSAEWKKTFDRPDAGR